MAKNGNNPNVHKQVNGSSNCSMSQLWNTHCSAIQKEQLIHPTTEVGLTILSERSWAKRVMCCVVHLYKITETSN